MINWDDVKLPDGMDKDAMMEEIYNIARTKSREHASINKFWFQAEDLFQEIVIKCIKALTKYDPSKSYQQKFRSYFHRCADNIVADLKRKHIFHYATPCRKCDHWDKRAKKMGEHDCKEFSCKTACPLFRKYKSDYKAKYTLGINWSDSNTVREDTSGSGQDEPLENSKAGSPLDLKKSYNDNAFGSLELVESLGLELSEEAFAVFHKLAISNFNPKAVSPREKAILKVELAGIYDLGLDENND